MTRLQRKPLQAGMRITHTITNRSRKLLLSNPIIKENLIITLDNQSKSHSLWSVWLPGGPAAIPRPKPTSRRCTPPPLSLSFHSPFSSLPPTRMSSHQIETNTCIHHNFGAVFDPYNFDVTRHSLPHLKFKHEMKPSGIFFGYLT